MQDVLTLTDLEQVKTLADPLRLGEKPARLYYHVEALEKLGLIELVETRPNRGTLEKYYRATARKFVANHNLFTADADKTASTDELQMTLAAFFDTTRDEVARSTAADLFTPETIPAPAIFSRGYIRATPEQMRQLGEKLQAWLEESRNAGTDTDNSIDFALTVAFYPVSRKDADDEQ